MIAGLMEWTKWDLDQIKRQPMRPMMILMHIVNQQRKELEEEFDRNTSHSQYGSQQINLSDDRSGWRQQIMSNPQAYRR